MAAPGLARTYIWEGTNERAEKLLLEALTVSPDTETGGGRMCQLVLVEARLESGKIEEARAAVDSLLKGLNAVDIPWLGYVAARTAAKAGDVARALSLADSAFEGARTTGDRTLLWRAYALSAELNQSTEPATAAAATTAAKAGIEDAETADSFREKALLFLPATVTEDSPASQLTPRELEIARHVAQGKSNHAIAEELVVSTRTVETHVANVLGKLQFTSHAQVIAWAAEALPALNE